jgi:4-amino-4-deoxy-L-arabinose transferase-like glycosyltransferase
MLLAPARSRMVAATPRERSPSGAWSGYAWVLIALTAVGAVLRFATIASQSYWLDESTTVHELHLSFGGLLHAVHVNETTPPLYFVLAWLWSKVFGTGEVGLRALSAVAGVAVIPLAYLCGRELVSRRAGLVAAALVALSPFMIWYSQEARSYMLLTAFCGASLLFFAQAWRRPSSRRLAWWAVFSGLAVLTHFFAGFLVAPEAVLLLYANRDRGTLLAVGAVVAAQLAMLPLALSDSTHPLNWITAYPLSIRIQQVPVQFALASLYQSSLVTYGLVGAAVLAGTLIVLLVIGATRRQLVGAAMAAGLAAFVVLVPLALAEVGPDYYLARNLMPAWIPLAVVIGAACTAPRARLGGACLAGLLLAAFVWAGVRIDDNKQYQRPDWRGVATALGRASVPRAIVADDGSTAAGPIAVYLSGVPWPGSGQAPAQSPAPVKVGEVDLVGNVYQTPARTLPPGMSLLTRKRVDGYVIERFLLARDWTLSEADIATRVESLLSPPSGGASVLLQYPTPAH